MNPIMAVVRGTSQTLSEGAKSIGSTMKREMLPTGAVYNLGMGIGPLIQNIVEQSNKPTSSPSKPDVGGFQKKELNFLSAQFNTMISILRDIKSIGMLQLKNDQLKAFQERQASFLQKESEAESLANRPFLSATTKSTKSKSEESKGSSLMDFIPGVLKLAGAALAGKWVWDNLIDDNIKQDLKEKLTELTKNIAGWVTGSLWDAIKDNPLEAAAISAIVLGSLGFPVGLVLRAGVGAVSAVSGAAVSALGAGAAATAAVGTAVARAKTPSPALNKIEPTLGPSRPSLVPQPAPSTVVTDSTKKTMGSVLANLGEATKQALANAKHGDILIKSVGNVIKILPGIGAALSTYSAKESYEEGKPITAALNAVSATLSALTAASFMTGVGAPASVPLAIGATGFSLLAAGASYFEKSSNQNIETAPASNLASQQSQGLTDEMVNNLSAVLGKRESSNNLQAENEFGYMGKYQFGVQALETLGYLKKGATEQMNKLGGERGGGQQKVLNDPSMWMIGSKEEFMKNSQMQEKAFKQLLKFNYDLLESKNLINKDSTKEHVAGLLSGMHLKGLGGVKDFLSGKTTRDAYGTSVADYYQLGYNAEAGIKNHVSRQNLDSDRNQKGIVLDDLTNVLANYLMTGSIMPSIVDQSQQIVNNVSNSGAASAPPPQTTSRIGDAVRHTQ